MRAFLFNTNKCVYVYFYLYRLNSFFLAAGEQIETPFHFTVFIPFHIFFFFHYGFPTTGSNEKAVICISDYVNWNGMFKSLFSYMAMNEFVVLCWPNYLNKDRITRWDSYLDEFGVRSTNELVLSTRDYLDIKSPFSLLFSYNLF